MCTPASTSGSRWVASARGRAVTRSAPARHAPTCAPPYILTGRFMAPHVREPLRLWHGALRHRAPPGPHAPHHHHPAPHCPRRTVQRLARGCFPQEHAPIAYEARCSRNSPFQLCRGAYPSSGCAARAPDRVPPWCCGSLGLTDYLPVDILGVRCKPVTFRAATRPGSRNQCHRI
jgi:hypothetical protein